MSEDTHIHLSERTTRVGETLIALLLPSARLAVATSDGLSESRVKRGVRELCAKGMGHTHELGCLLPAAPRFVWTETGLGVVEATEAEKSWHREAGMINLLQHDFARVEGVTSLAPLYATKGWELDRIRWYERQPMAAVAEYSHPDYLSRGCIVFCWASMLETERDCYARLTALPEAMQAQVVARGDDKFEPSGVVILAASEWPAARALCMAREILSTWSRPDSSITAWYYGSGGWHVSNATSARYGEPPREMPTVEWPAESLRPTMSTRRSGTRTMEHVLAHSLYAGRGSQTLVQMLTTVCIYPCGAAAHYQALIGEKGRGYQTRHRLKSLEKLGLIEIVTERGRARRRPGWSQEIPITLSDRGQGEPRYAATTAGRTSFCHVHGGHPHDLHSRTGLGRLKTVVRDRVLLQLLTMTWMAHISCIPGAEPLDQASLEKIAGHWKLDRRNRQGVLVHLLTLACLLHREGAEGVVSLTEIGRTWGHLSEGIIEDQWPYQHQDLVYEILGQLRAHGCAFAPGWMASTTLGDGRTSIDPDAVVQVQTPWGRTWCYLEVELSDRTENAVRPRCKKYGSESRRDALPLLVVCRDEQAEEAFQREALLAERAPRMLTTTLYWLRAGGVFGTHVWSDYGTPFTLRP